MKQKNKVIQVTLSKYAIGIWYDTIEFNPKNQTVTFFDHLFKKEITMAIDEHTYFREIEGREWNEKR